MPLIEQALQMGYSEDQLLNFLGSQFKDFKSGINNAKKIGYAGRDILKFLSGNLSRRKPSEEDMAPGERFLKESGYLTKEQREERTRKGLQTALGVGAGALGLAALGGGLATRAFPAVEAVRGMLGNEPEGQQPVENVQPSEPPQRQPISSKILEGFDISSLPESRQKEVQFLSMVADQLESKGISPSDPEMQNVMRKLRKATSTKLSVREQEEQRFKKAYPESANQVITPEGDLADIVEQPGKTSKVSIDGKNKVYPTEKLTPIPENKDEILDLYERLIQAIPETERSAVINWAGYDPERKKFAVRFHSGDAYSYEDIPEEFSKRIEEAGFLAKTTGGNMFGQWAEGEASRGAGLHKLIMDLQKHYGGKGKEYSAKMKTVYSYLGPAERKLKEKLDREREEKRKRKKERQP